MSLEELSYAVTASNRYHFDSNSHAHKCLHQHELFQVLPPRCPHTCLWLNRFICLKLCIY